MDPPLVMEYATSLTRHCDDYLLLEHSTAASSVMLTAFDRLSLNKHSRSSSTARQASLRHYYVVRQLVVPPAHAVGDVFPPPLAGAATTTSSHVGATASCRGRPVTDRRATYRRRNNNAAARPLRRSLVVARSPRHHAVRAALSAL